MPFQPTMTLTEEQIAFYRENGFLAIEAITTQEEIERLRGVYDRLFEQNAGRAEGNQFDLVSPDEEGKAATLPQILSPRKYAPELADTLYEANARAISNQLLGADVTFRLRPCDLQTRRQRGGDALASGRSLLGRRHPVPFVKCLDAFAGGNDRKRLHGFPARKP